MTRRTQIGLIAAAVALSAAVVLVVSLAGGGPATEQARAGESPGMRLDAAGNADCNNSGCTAPTGSVFQLRVIADPVPEVPIAGFQTEIDFGGLRWLRRDCKEEVRVKYQGDPPDICAAAVGPAGGQARHVGGPARVQATPLPALDTPLGTLLELNVRCSAEGSHELALTAAAADESEDSGVQSSFGAAYYTTDSTPLFPPGVGTRDLVFSVDPTTSRPSPPQPVLVADTLEVTCEGAPPPGSDATATAEADDATATAQAGGGNGNGTPAANVTVSAEDATATAEREEEDATATAEQATEDSTATAEAIAGGGGNGDDDDGGGMSPVIWAVIGVAGAVAVGGLGYLGWRRTRMAGGTTPGGSAPSE